MIEAANAHAFMLDVDTPEYNETLEVIERLHKLHSHEKEGRKVSPDTLLLVLGNLAGILLILNYERLQIVTSKSFGLLIKPKI